MKRLCFIFIFFVFCGISIFCDNDEQEEIDFLLFMPNSSNQFVNEEQTFIQLDNLAKYLKNKDIVSEQIIVNGYAAYAPNDIEPVDLSRERAVFVINELRKRGVSNDLFSAPIGHGSVYLWGNNSGEDDRKPNRRVRILLGGESPTQITPDIVNAEIDIEIFENVQEEAPAARVLPVTPVKPADTREKSDFRFPLWILLVLPLLLLLFLLLKNKSRKTARQVVNKNAQSEISETETVYIPEPVPEQMYKPVPEPTPVLKQKPVPPPEPVITHKHEPVPVHKPEPAYKHELASSSSKTEIKVNLDEEIRFRAYELSERRHWHGDYMEQDWYDAMREISALYIYQGYTVYFEDGYWWAAKSS